MSHNRARSYLKYLAFCLVAAVAAGIGLIFVLAFSLESEVSQLPSKQEIVKNLDARNMNFASQILDRKGRSIGSIRLENRIFVPLDNIPKHVINAFISAEDKDFFEHGGVSLPAIFRAFKNNMLRSGGRLQGASTITQQLARMYFLTRSQTYVRKAKEIVLAYKMESALSKQEILELYLNKIFLGNRSYGVEAAAQNYFGKSIAAVSVAEAALLAAIPKAPSRLDPNRNFNLVKGRQVWVIDQMKANGYLDRYEAEDAQKELLRYGKAPTRTNNAVAYFLDIVHQEFTRRFEHWRPAVSGLKVYTSLDLGWQRRLIPLNEKIFRLVKQSALQSNFDAESLERIKSGGELQMAQIVIDPRSGEILSVQGARDYQESQFNRAVSMRRELSAAVLPIIYASALEKGYQLSDPIDMDLFTRRSEGIGPPSPGLYESFLKAQVYPLFQMYQKIGMGYAAQKASRCGLQVESGDILFGMGKSQHSLKNAASCMASFAAGGRRYANHVIGSILSQDGELMWRHQKSYRQVFDENVAGAMLTLLQHFGRFGPIREYLPYQGFHLANMVAATDNLQNLWLFTLTPTAIIANWFGAESGKIRVARSREQAYALAGKIIQTMIKVLPPQFLNQPFPKYSRVRNKKHEFISQSGAKISRRIPFIVHGISSPHSDVDASRGHLSKGQGADNASQESVISF